MAAMMKCTLLIPATIMCKSSLPMESSFPHLHVRSETKLPFALTPLTVYVGVEEGHVSVYDNKGWLLTRFKCGERKEDPGMVHTQLWTNSGQN